MNPIKFRFELRNSAPDRAVAALYLEFPKEAGGLKWVSFYQTVEEWLALLEHGGFAQDCYHYLTTLGECFTFFNFEPGRAANSCASVPYARVSLPRDVRKLLAQNLRFDLEALRTSEKESTFTQDYSSKLEEWARRYGQGKGYLKIEASDEIRARFEAAQAAGGESFKRSWQSISGLALGTTHSIDDVGIVRLYPDGERSFGWSAGGLHGGLINHGTDSEPDWSVHT